MQIFNMMVDLKATGSTPAESVLPTTPGEAMNQEDITSFLAQLELAFSQANPVAEGEVAWSQIELTETGELLDPSGNELPLSELVDGQVLPLQVAPQFEPESPILTQIKMATESGKVQLPPQLASQLTAQAPPEKSDLLAEIDSLRVASGELSAAPVMPALPTLAVTALEQTGLSSHLPASLAVVAPMISSSTPQAALAQLPTIQQPVGERGWGQELGDRVKWMVGQEIQGAEVKLNPRGLGPVEIRVTLQNDQANVTFVAHHAATREAIDAAIPRLREMFSEANVNLVNVDVGDQNSASFNGRAESEGREQQSGDAMTLFGEQEEEESTGVRLVSNGLLDDYA